MKAEEFLNRDYISTKEHAIKAMIEFAKHHVTLALSTAAKIDFESVTHVKANDYEEALKLTIEECYPLNLIQ